LIALVAAATRIQKRVTFAGEERLHEYNDDELLERAHRAAAAGHGGLAAEEVDALARRLEQTTLPEERYRLLKIFGYVGDVSYRHIIEPFLAGPDPGSAEWALFVLCHQWGLTGQYIDPILTFLPGVPWDDELRTVQTQAFFCTNDYLLQHTEPKLLRELIYMAETEGNDEDARERAYSVLANLVAGPITDPAMVLHQAKARLRKEEANAAGGPA
jgi:hypothetical protein